MGGVSLKSMLEGKVEGEREEEGGCASLVHACA